MSGEETKKGACANADVLENGDEGLWIEKAVAAFEEKYGRAPGTDEEIGEAEELAGVPAEYRLDSEGEPVVNSDRVSAVLNRSEAVARERCGSLRNRPMTEAELAEARRKAVFQEVQRKMRERASGSIRVVRKGKMVKEIPSRVLNPQPRQGLPTVRKPLPLGPGVRPPQYGGKKPAAPQSPSGVKKIAVPPPPQYGVRPAPARRK